MLIDLDDSFDLSRYDEPLDDNEYNILFNPYTEYISITVDIIYNLNSDDLNHIQQISGYNVKVIKECGIPVEMSGNDIIIRYENAFDVVYFIYPMCVGFYVKYLQENVFKDKHSESILINRPIYQNLINDIEYDNLTFVEHYLYKKNIYKTTIFKRYRELVPSINNIESLIYFRDIIFALHYSSFKKYKDNSEYSRSKSYIYWK